MTIVTVNTRLARRLRREFDREREAAGDQFWESPDILPWRAWIKRLWDELIYTGRDNRVLLSTAQELVLWEQVIRTTEDLLSPEGTAQVAAQAWMLVHQWRLTRAEAAYAEVPDTAAFFRWMQSFQQLLKARGFITEAEVPEVVMKKGFQKPDEHAGFDEMTPVEREMFAGSEERALAYPVTTSKRYCGLPDVADEIRGAARWARERIELNPAAKVGVVFPDLSARRAAVSRVFEEVLGTAEAFHISAPVPLAETPIVRAAILALKAGTLAEVGEMLQSPYFQRPLQEGAREDLALRRRGVVRREVIDRTQRPGQWSVAFSEMASAAGWPGKRGLNSYEYQAAKSWRELLGEFARFDLMIGDIDFNAAVYRLERLARQTGFGAEETDEPVQIMGIAEAEGSRFDALWVGGLHDGVWPPAPRPHPFLPLKPQRAAGLSRSSVEFQAALAKRITGRLLRSADDVVLSYPESDGETELRESPLMAMAGRRMAMEVRREVAAVAELESLEPDRAPPLGETRSVKGGMSVIADQSACAFRAFAKYRLGARGLDEAEPGLTDRERGTVTHVALQWIWESLGSQKKLIETEAGDLMELVRSSVRRALDEKLGEGSKGLKRTQALEVRRLSGLILEWLEMEKKRPAFETSQIELRQKYALGGLELDVRADRVDRYQDGTLAILDYKTGITSRPKQWETERPDAPQLPIYSLLVTQPVSTIAFAQLAAGVVTLKGISECSDSGLKAGKAYTISDQIEDWREILHALGKEFVDGYAAVKPNPGACTFCELSGLCRIAEIGKESSDG